MICTEFTTQPLPTNWKFQDLTGRKFNFLEVKSYAGKQGLMSRWNCVCDCGNKTVVRSDALKTGHIKSCGCMQKELIGNSHRSHGDTKTAEYQAYRNAKARCENPNNVGYKDYGGRGIEFRFESFEEFLAEVGRKPTPEHTIDRKDTNGHYEKGNVKWSTPLEQNRNKRSNTILVIDGVSSCVAAWSEVTGVGITTILQRLKYGWCGHCSVTIPVRKRTCPHRTHIGIKLLEKQK